MRLLPVLPWLIVAAGCRIGAALVRQNGRILLRLDALEQRLAELATLMTAASPQAVPAVAAPPPALPLDTPAPDFELPDLAGQRHALSALRGRRVLLIAFSPQCGFCTQMLPALATLPVDGRDRAPIPLVLTTGDAEQNRKLVAEHELRCRVLLQTGSEVTTKYGLQGTPMGYLIDEAGRIASEVAVGADALLVLARDADPHALSNGAASGGEQHKAYHGNRSLAESHLKRDGLSAGTPAPVFTLPRLDGGELSLAEFRGQPLLLIFSDPNCGPCMQLAPQLEAFHRRTPQLPLLVISRGEVEPNRQKATKLGLSFPVVLQKSWEVSRSYAMFATPIGYRIDADGIIAEEVAVGVEPILALAARAAAALSSTTANGAARA